MHYIHHIGIFNHKTNICNLLHWSNTTALLLCTSFCFWHSENYSPPLKKMLKRHLRQNNFIECYIQSKGLDVCGESVPSVKG